jgi:hypothetical protein
LVEEGTMPIVVAEPNDLRGVAPFIKKILDPPRQVEHDYLEGTTITRGYKFSSSYQTHIFTTIAKLSHLISEEDFAIHHHLGVPDLRTLYTMATSHQTNSLPSTTQPMDGATTTAD